jgi:hypothetical protein
MLDLVLPFSTYLTASPDMSEADLKLECRRLFERQQAIGSWLDGKLPHDVLLDMLAEHQIDPYQWAEVSLDNVEVLWPGLL